ncbi:MAG: NosD protein [Ardenticatenaceae bacterium]|nr:MAG: NosD protein [Ardenticatenaceae bacterium]
MNSKQWLQFAFSLLLLAFILLTKSGQTLAQSDGDTIITAVDLKTAVANAQPGDTIQVSGGTFMGSLVIDKSLTLIGIEWPVIDGQNEGTVVSIQAPNVTLRGFVIQNSGHVLDQENSGIAVEAENALIEGNRFENTLFGIYLRKGHGTTIRDNQITSKDLDVPRRGDPIRVWYSNDVLIENNVVTKGRDVVLWYSERLTIRNNDVSDGRYGLHFMYCDDAIISQNRLLNNSVGAFMMYSRRVNLISNTISGNRGPSGYGIGLKDMDDAVIENNLFLDNRVGAHLDTTPREVDSVGKFNGNVFAYNDIGVEMLPSVRNNEFVGNSFVENEEQVSIAGSGGLFGANSFTVGGEGNFWSDYAGYDADADGQGDVEYKSDRLFENLMEQSPELRLFLYSPATNAIDFAAKAFPAVRPRPKLVDERPSMTPSIPADAPVLPRPAGQGWLWATLALLAVAVGLATLPKLHWRRYRFENKLETG